MNVSTPNPTWHFTLGSLFPGVLLCAVIALSASFVSEHYGGPQLLYALLIGLAFHFLSRDSKIGVGIDFCSKTLLRTGVALMGLRITLAQVGALGWSTGALVTLGVATTIAMGLLLAVWFGRPNEEGLLSGCSVAICGASAALAVASVLPQTPKNERFTLMTVIGVTLMSTLAMVVYPLVAARIGLPSAQAGVFFGATIHDVAQVVAAGMMLSGGGDTAAATSATIVKLYRVMLLVPVVLLVSVLINRSALPTDKSPHVKAPALVPWFLLAFVGCMLLASFSFVPVPVSETAGAGSRALLVMSIAAAGVKTSFEDLFKLGWTPVLMLLIESLWIAAFAGTGLVWFGIARV